MAKRGRKPKERINYFDELEESAVLEYMSCKDDKRKNEIYNMILKPAFDKMVESIIRRYNLTLPDELFEDTFQDTLSFLITKINKFENGKISKKTGKEVRAYSYYQTVVKNYLLGRLKKYNKEIIRYPSYDSAPEDVSNSIKNISEDTRSKVIASEIVDKLLKRTNKIIVEESGTLKDSELKIAKALANLLENWDYVLSTDGSNKLNKSAILLFLRENTGLDTKGVRDSLRKFKNEYTAIKKEVIELN